MKFVALPLEAAYEPAFAPAVPPTTRRGPFAALKAFVFRVIGCLEAARP